MEFVIRKTRFEEYERACKELPYNPTQGIRGITFADKDDQALGVTMYDNWTPNAVHMHVWSKSSRPWFCKDYLKEIFRYPLEICAKGLVIAYTQGDNTPVLEFCRQVGFTEKYRVKDGWKLGTDLVIQEMRREQCPWVSRGSEHGILLRPN